MLDRSADFYHKRWAIIGILCSVLVLLFAGIMFAGASTWYAYNQTFGAKSAAKGWLQQEGASYNIDVYDQLMAVKRLEIYCLLYSTKQIEQNQFNLLRRQASSTLTNFEPGSVLAQSVSSHESFKPAYEAMQGFIKIAEALEEGRADIKDVLPLGTEAARAWGELTVDANTREFAARDGMSRAIVDFRPLAVRAFTISSILLALLAISTAAAAYAAWRAWKAERRRFDRFEILLATVGHDLRSPLQALVGAAKLAAADTVVAEREKFVRIVHERSAYFTRLLDDLVNLARSESLSFVGSPINLNEWFDTASARYRQAAESKGLEFSAILDSQATTIVFDSHRLTQCADNLISNAIRYTETGSVRFEIKCEKNADSEAILTMIVSDTGRGIALADQGRIFEPFVRVDSAVRGMGIGLSMVASLARRIGGSVDVKSALNQGSVFTFTAPVSITTAPLEAACLDDSKVTPKTIMEASVPRVLVVDDDPYITQVVGGLLPHMGFAADTALGGRTGLELALKNQYCAILTDLQMPDLDGFELAASVRSAKTPCPVLIAMTAYTSKPSADDRAKVFDVMLRKPFDGDELGDLLDNAATRWESLTLNTRRSESINVK